MLGNFSRFCCRLLTLFKINFFKKEVAIIKLRHSAEPDLDLRYNVIFSQRLSTDDKVATLIIVYIPERIF